MNITRNPILTVFFGLSIALTLNACDEGIDRGACESLDPTVAGYQDLAAECSEKAQAANWPAKCGNGYKEIGESCDGFDMTVTSCSSIPRFGEFGGGGISCNPEFCSVDSSNCKECYTYPCGPYAGDTNGIIENLTFSAADPVALEFVENRETLDLSSIYTKGIAHEGTYKGLLIFQTAGWCPYCGDEASYLNNLYLQLKDQGILMLGVVSQTESGAAASSAYATGYANRYAWTFPTVTGDIPAKYEKGGLPLNILVDLSDMSIHNIWAGAGPEYQMKTELESLLQSVIAP